MNSEQMLSHMRAACEHMIDTAKKKNADYTGGSADPFANFTMVEKLGICTTVQGMMTRMTDKWMRLTSFVKQGTLQVKDESVQDTLQDLSAYCLLMSAYLESLKADPRYTATVTTVTNGEGRVSAP